MNGSTVCSTPAVESGEVRAVTATDMERPPRSAQRIVERPEAPRAVTLQRDPHLERVDAARAGEAAEAVVRTACAMARVEEIGRALAEGGFEVGLVANEDDAGRQRHQHHLVRIPRDRVGARDAGQAVAVRGREQRRRAVRAVDVQPDAASLAQRCRSPRGRRTSPSRSCRRWRRRPSPRGPRGAGGRARARARRRPYGSRRTGSATTCRCRFPVRRPPAPRRSARARRTRPPAGSRRRRASTRRGSRPGARRAGPANVASVPPDVNVPPASGPSPARSHIQRIDLRLDHRPHGRHLPHGARLVEGRGQGLGPDRDGKGRRHLVAHRFAGASGDCSRGARRARAAPARPSSAAVRRKRFVEPARELFRRQRRGHAAGAVTRGLRSIGQKREQTPRQLRGPRRVRIPTGQSGVT